MESDKAESPAPRGLAYVTALYDISLAGVWLLYGALLLEIAGLSPGCRGAWRWTALCAGISALHVAAGVGIGVWHPWGTRAQRLASAIDLLVPWWRGELIAVLLVIWTLPAALCLAFWLRPFVGRVARLALGTALVVALCANALLVAGGPHVSRAAYESAAVGDLRTLITTEEAYSKANNGFYGTPRCLALPAQCPDAAAADERHRLSPDDVGRYRGSLHGYTRTFHAGQAADVGPASGARLKAFACTAVPLRNVLGEPVRCRSFCADSTGIICVADAERGPRVLDGRCDLSTCTPLE